MPALALPLSCRGSRGAKTRGQSSLFRAAGTPDEPGARRLAAAFAGAEARGRSGGIGAPNPAPQVRAAAAAPGAASGRSPRPRSRASSSTRSRGCWAAGAGEPGMGAGAARPSIAAAADPGSSTRPSRPAGGEQFPRQDPGKKKKKKKGQNPERLVLTAKPWGARAVPLLHASAAAAGPARRRDATGSPSGASGCGMEAAPGTGGGVGPPGMPPGAPTARQSRGARDARANNTASRRCPAPPPPRATLHNRARGPAPAAGGAAGRSPPGLTTCPRSCARPVPGL